MTGLNKVIAGGKTQKATQRIGGKKGFPKDGVENARRRGNEKNKRNSPGGREPAYVKVTGVRKSLNQRGMRGRGTRLALESKQNGGAAFPRTRGKRANAQKRNQGAERNHQATEGQGLRQKRLQTSPQEKKRDREQCPEVAPPGKVKGGRG